MIGIIITFMLWYLSGGLEMFLHDLPSFGDIFTFKMPLLIPDANYYINEVPVNYNYTEADNEFLINDMYGLHDYGLDEEYFLNNDEVYIMNLNNQVNNQAINIDEIDEIYEDDTLKAIEESIKDLN